MAEPIGALRVELSTSIAKFEADLGKARQAARNFSTGVNKSLKDMGGGFGGLGSQIGKMAASFAIATVAVNAISSAIRGTVGLIKDSISASAAQAAQEKTLAKFIENTGVSYASVREELEKTITAIQRSTTFADDEQRPVLQSLIALTGDYATSLKALPLVLDASVALQQDAKTTALLFGKALAGNVSSLTRYGIQLDKATQEAIKNADASERLEILSKALGDRWKGSASAAAANFQGQLKQLSDAWGDLKETIGDFITKSPQVQDAINKIEDRIFKWIDALEKNKEAQEKFEKFIESSIEALESFGNAFITIIEKGAQFHNFLAETGKKIGQFIADLELIQQPIVKAVERLDLIPLTKDQETLVTSLSELGVAFELTSETVKEDTKAVEKNREEIVKHSDAAKKGKSAIEQLNDSFKKQVETLEKQVATFGLTAEQIIEFDRQLAISKGVIPEVANRVAELSLELNDLEEAAKDTAEAWEELFSMDEEIEALQEELDQIDFQAFLDKTEPQLDSFAEFVGSTFGNIAQDIGNAIIEAGSVWEAVINSMKRVVADLIGFLIANPIRLLFEEGAKGGAGIFSGIKNIFSTGFSSITSILSGAFSGITGFFSLIGKALPLIGTIVSVVTVGIGLISKLFEKAPEVHIDIGRFNKEIEDRFAFVKDFIELSDDVNSDLAKDLVTIKKGKIGIDNTELRQIIFDKINAVITGLQEMLNQLPVDMAKTLNELLLNTQLIDFDEATKRIIGIDYTGKEAKKRLEQFLSSGELEAEFVASISPFFEEFYKQLGVLPEAATRLIEDFKTAFAGASPEQQVLLGQEFLAQMQAYIDAFNFLNDIAVDSFQAAINQIEALSIDLGVAEGGIPDLAQVKEALQALFDAGELTPEIVEKFLALADAIELFDEAVDDMFDKISQFGKGAFEVAINEIKDLTEELGIKTRSGIPTLKQLGDALEDLIGSADITKEAFRELVESGEITPELIDKFAELRQALIDLASSLASSIQTILQTIQRLNQQIFDLGGSIVPTSGFIEDQIKLLTEAYWEEGITIEEQLAILDQLEGLINDLNNAFIQENTLQSDRIENAQNMIRAITNEIAAVNAHIDALRIEKQRIEEVFKARIKALEEERKLIEEIARERINALEDEKSAIQSAFGLRDEEKYAVIEQLNLLQDLRNQVQADFDERIRLTEEQHKSQVELQAKRFRLSIDAINAQIDTLNDLLRIAETFKELVGSIADDILKVTLVGKVPEQQIGIIRSLIILEETMLRRLQGEAKLESLEKLRDLSLKLFEATQAAFQEPSLDFQAMQTEIVRNLEELQKIADEEAAKVEDIQARIASLNERIASINTQIEINTSSISRQAERLREQQQQQLAAIDAQIAELTIEAQQRIEEITLELEQLRKEEQEALAAIDAQIAELEAQQAAALASIDAQIAQANQHLVALNAQLQTQQAILTQQAELTAEQQAELRSLFEFLREQQLALLQERIRQQAELMGMAIATFRLEIEQTSLLREMRDSLKAIEGVESFQSGGFVQKTGLAFLHAGEFVIPPGESESSRSVHINVNINGDMPSNPTAINMLSDSLVSKIKNEIVQDMEYGKLGKVTVRRVGLA